jgi:CRP-like cAMP-binding protein
MQQVIEYRKLEVHEILCAEGDLPDYYYVIVSGR